MDGKEFIKSLPATAIKKREELIFEAIRNKDNHPITWTSIKCCADNHLVEFFVMKDCLRIGHTNPVRVNVSAYTMTQIADYLGLHLQTTKICDLVWMNSIVKISPTIFPPNNAMANTSVMLDHSNKIDAKIGSGEGLIGNVGKHWVTTNKFSIKPDKAANYGWYDKSAPQQCPVPGYNMWQNLGTVHDVYHVDYSQVIRFVQSTVLVNGVEMDIEEIGNDKDLCTAISYEGTIKYWRPPSVPVYGKPDETKLVFNRTLKYGCRGDDVGEWQQFLNDHVTATKADGIFGIGTKTSTIDFQKKNNLVGDGMVGPNTLKKANEILSQPS